jgi:hypothetical protein
MHRAMKKKAKAYKAWRADIDVRIARAETDEEKIALIDEYPKGKQWET